MLLAHRHDPPDGPDKENENGSTLARQRYIKEQHVCHVAIKIFSKAIVRIPPDRAGTSVVE